MSGAEAVTVIGLISSVITIIKTSRQLYDAATNAKGLHEAFRAVSINIPLVLEIQRKCKEVQEKADQEYQDTTSAARKRELENSAEAVKPIMRACEENASNLQAIFEKVVPGERATWFEHYRKATQAILPGKKRKVEDLMKGILEQLQLLHTDHFFKSVAEEKSDDLAGAIEHLSSLPSSLPDGDDRFHHSGSGPMNNLTGSGKQTNNTISGGTNNRQYIGDTQNFKD